MFGTDGKDAWTWHVNPDGSKGGQISKSASVDPEAYISPWAVVMAGATIFAKERVEGGSIVLSDNSRTLAPR